MKPSYYGETEPMYSVVEAINRNNQRLPTLWAEIASLRLAWVDDRQKRRDESLEIGTLQFLAPRSVRVRAGKLIKQDLIDIGTNKDLYWLVANDPGPDTAWWGRFKHLGSACAQPIPIRPDLLLEVLGVGTIDDDFNRLPVPVMKFNHDADAYMLTWNTRLPDRWVAVKEVWYDRQTKRPKFVLLFDADGRVVLRAFLEEHRPVEVADVPKDQWPVVATRYRLFFPESKSDLVMRFGDVRVTRQTRGTTFPNEKSFNFIPRAAGVSKVIQLDEACGE